MAGKPEALLVDWGGVLTTPILESFASFVQQYGVDAEALPKLFKEAYTEGADPAHPVLAIETGRITEEEFGRALADLLSEGLDAPIPAEGIKEKLFATIQPDHAMIEGVRAIHRAGFRTGLVSNSWGGSSYAADLLGDLFDDVVVSGRVGLRKPDPEIYRLAAKLVGVEPERCVFIDDISTNVKGAEAVGMTGLLHRTATETLPELERLFGVILTRD
ncbi:MAG: HAD family phosphatase [Actinobacteria bacterium]|nr:HAD family phosphatase [Actinomycetota bacterium]